MLKLLTSIVLILITAVSVYVGLKEESFEYNFTRDTMKFIMPWHADQQYPIACNQEGVERYGELALDVNEIQALLGKAHNKCIMEATVGITMGITMIMAETIYIPYKAAPIVELAKFAIQAEKPLRCSDYVKPIISTCPNLLSIYLN